MFEFLWDLSQEQRIGRLEARGRSAGRAGHRAEAAVETLEQRLDRLELACAAMWELLKESGRTEAELLDRMQAVDARDGKADGRLRREPRRCPSCGRTAGRARTSCVYCSEKLPPDAPFGG